MNMTSLPTHQLIYLPSPFYKTPILLCYEIQLPTHPTFHQPLHIFTLLRRLRTHIDKYNILSNYNISIQLSIALQNSALNIA